MKSLIFAVLLTLTTVGCCTTGQKLTSEEKEQFRERRMMLLEHRGATDL